MWPLDYKKRAQLKIEAENAAWEKYSKSLAELNERSNRRIHQQAWDFDAALKQIAETLTKSWNESKVQIEAGFKSQLDTLIATHAEEIQFLRRELEAEKIRHVAEIESKNYEVTAKISEYQRKQTQLDATIQKYETSIGDAVKVSGQLQELIAGVNQQTLNEKVELQRRQAVVKEADNTNNQLRQVTIPQIRKSVEGKPS